MAVRQYVGARYVPQIMGDWNDQTVYEPLSIVHYNFASYTSKKAVPAGVEPTNEEYWALTSQDSQQVEAYRQELEDLKTAVNPIIETVQSRYTLKNRRFVMLGDSYMAGYPNFIPFTTRAKNYLNLNDNQWFVVANGGAAFYNTVAPAVSFYNELISSANLVDDPSTITDVFVIGGTNENLSNMGQTLSNMNQFATKARELYPNAQLTCALLTFGTAITLPATRLQFYSRSVAYGMKFIDMSPLFHDLNSCYDSSHPNQNGQNIIGWGLAGYITGGNISWCDGTFTLSTNNNKMYVTSTGRGVEIRGKAQINFDTPYAGDNITIGTIENTYIFNHEPIVVIIYFVKDGLFIPAYGNLMINENKEVIIRPFAYDPAQVQGSTRFFVNPFYQYFDYSQYNTSDILG